MENAPSCPFLMRQNIPPYTNTKANRIPIALVESKLQSILILSLITNIILCSKLLAPPFLSCYSFYHETVPAPSPMP